MHKTYAILAVSGFALALSACSRPEAEPQPVFAQPVYDKYGGIDDGGGGCPGGRAVAGTAGVDDCLPPGDFQRRPDPTGAGSGTSGGGQTGTAPRE